MYVQCPCMCMGLRAHVDTQVHRRALLEWEGWEVWCRAGICPLTSIRRNYITTVGQQYTGIVYVYSKLLGALSYSGGWQWRTTLNWHRHAQCGAVPDGLREV